MRLTPLHDDSTQRDKRGDRSDPNVACSRCGALAGASAISGCCDSAVFQATRCPNPLTEGRVEVLRRGKAARDGRARRSWAMDGPSSPAPGATPEGGESGRAAGRPGCWGALSLWSLFLYAGKEKVTRPAGRKPPVPEHSVFSLARGFRWKRNRSGRATW